MSYKKQKLILDLVFINALCFLLIPTSPAYAYLDPGSGSMMLQVLLGGVAALVVILKLYWRRVLTLFGIDKKKKENPESDNMPDS